MKHTDGPWFVGPTPYYLMQGQAADGKSRQAQPVTIRSPAHTEEICTVWNYLLPTDANASLIAAAPDLLAALRVAVKHLEGDGFSCNDIIEAGNAAIAKAEGKP